MCAVKDKQLKLNYQPTIHRAADAFQISQNFTERPLEESMSRADKDLDTKHWNRFKFSEMSDVLRHGWESLIW